MPSRRFAFAEGDRDNEKSAPATDKDASDDGAVRVGAVLLTDKLNQVLWRCATRCSVQSNVRPLGSALVCAVGATRFPTIDPPRLAFRFVILIAGHLQLNVAMIAAGGIG